MKTHGGYTPDNENSRMSNNNYPFEKLVEEAIDHARLVNIISSMDLVEDGAG